MYFIMIESWDKKHSIKCDISKISLNKFEDDDFVMADGRKIYVDEDTFGRIIDIMRMISKINYQKVQEYDYSDQNNT